MTIVIQKLHNIRLYLSLTDVFAPPPPPPQAPLSQHACTHNPSPSFCLPHLSLVQDPVVLLQQNPQILLNLGESNVADSAEVGRPLLMTWNVRHAILS